MTRALLLLPLAACVDHQGGITGTQSLEVKITSPTNLGSDANRLDPTAVSSVTFDVTAYGADGAIDTTFSNDLQVYVQFLGTLTPYLGGMPLTTVHMSGGKATNQTAMLPLVFGPATLWLDDDGAAKPTYAAGASDPIWFRDPFIADVQFSGNEMSPAAFETSPLDNKNIDVRVSRYGADGRLVVSSVFAQGYTVADMSCGAGGAPPCTQMDYDNLEVFSFSAPKDQNGDPIVEGQAIAGFAGGVSEFNGLKEIGFPQTFTSGTRDVNPAREPVPVKIDLAWFQPAQLPTMPNMINFARKQAAPIEIDNAKVCNLDADYDQYFQWKIDPAGVGGDCTKNKNVINLITTGVIKTDPSTLVGMTLPRVVGILRPVNIGTFHVWIVYPRGDADFTLP